MSDLPLHCHTDRRRPRVRFSERTNGIDSVEVEEREGRVELHLFLLRSLPPDDADAALFGAENVQITGGPADADVQIGEPDFRRAPDPARDDVAVVEVTGLGPRSRYTLRLVDTPTRPLADIDPRYRTADFTLAAGGPTDVDCLPAQCGTPPSSPPDLDHLAKDYASFRRLLLDRLAVTLPGWDERHAADLYLTLVEVLAYEADRLSYAQDAVATEAYLDTARLRTSVRRHARLVDHVLHEGCNARAWVCLAVEGDPVVDADALSFITRPTGIPTEGATIDPQDLSRARRRSYEVFEPCLPSGRARITAHDVTDPRLVAGRITTGADPALDHVRATLSEEERRLFGRDDHEDEELPALAAAIGRRLDALLQDVGLVRRAPQAIQRAISRHGTLNALTGGRLAANNRDELARLFPEGLAHPAHLRFHESQNEIHLYTWGYSECCLTAGATSATLRDTRDPESGTRGLRHLRPGDVLVLEEVLGPRSGVAADARPSQRHAVRLTTVRPGLDELRRVPVVEVSWDRADALPFPLVLSVIGPPPECALIEDVTVARGNVVLVDHGETVRGPGGVRLLDRGRTVVAVPFLPPHEVVPAGEVELCCTGDAAPAERPSRDPDYEPVLPRSPLVSREPLRPDASARAALEQDPRRAVPALAVFGPVTGPHPAPDVVDRLEDGPGARPTGLRYQRWVPRRDLLSSGPDDRHVVAEVDDDGVAHLRFGLETGARPTPGTRMLVSFRTGGGSAGNVGDGAIRHVVPRGGLPGGRILAVSNPLPASGGTDPEPLDQVRLLAPHAFRAHLERAVVAEDYAAIVQRDFPQVQRAVATVLLEDVDGEKPQRTVVSVRFDPVGTSADEPDLLRRIAQHLDRYRRIGHTVRVQQSTYRSIELVVQVRALPGHQPGAVRSAVQDRLSNRTLPDGTRGLFHPDAFTFGQPVPISVVLGAVHRVPGVAAATVTRLRFHGVGGDLPDGDVLRVAPDEVVRLDNDPDHPDHGSLTVELEDS
ncbi:putative baseplate assembly protein [Geodermatophilus sp. SYSU D01105]